MKRTWTANGFVFGVIDSRPCDEYLERPEEVNAELDEAGLVKLAYDAQFRQYRVRIDANLMDQGREAMIELAKRARASFGRAG